MSTCSPPAIAGHACSCAGVGASNAPSNHSRTRGLKVSSGIPPEYESERRYDRADMPECFVIMPISTPADHVATYGGDKLHFRHVLDHLFRPAVEQAGYTLRPPFAAGADLIHAEIIKNLEAVDLVLCDISTLNPN